MPTASSGLPITINADKALMDSLGLTSTTLEKLEAWANFSTLKANWYGDEACEVMVKITLVSHDFFKQHFIANLTKGWQRDEKFPLAYATSNVASQQKIFIALNSVQEQPVTPSASVEHDLQTTIQNRLFIALNHIATSLSLDDVEH